MASTSLSLTSRINIFNCTKSNPLFKNYSFRNHPNKTPELIFSSIFENLNKIKAIRNEKNSINNWRIQWYWV